MDIEFVEEEEDLPKEEIPLEQFVGAILDEHLERHGTINKPRYGIFWRGQLMKTRSGKIAFSTVGAAKVALYHCFYPLERAYINRHLTYTGRIWKWAGIVCSNVEGTESASEDVKRFREMLIKHVEIKKI